MLTLCQRPQEDAPLRAGPLPPVGLLPPGTEPEDRVHHSVSPAGTASGASADPLKMPFPHPSPPDGCLWAPRVGRASGSETQGEWVPVPCSVGGWVGAHLSSGQCTVPARMGLRLRSHSRRHPCRRQPASLLPQEALRQQRLALTLTCQVCSSERQLLGQRRRLEAVGGGGWGVGE